MGRINRLQAVWGMVATCRKMWAESPVQSQQHNSSNRAALVGWRSCSPARGMATAAVRIFIVAGEPSGDAIGSRLMASLRCYSAAPLDFAGVGGPLMEKQGLRSQFQMEDISVMGVVELIPHTLRLWARLQETVTAAVKFQPNVVVTVDAKGFSFRVLAGIQDAYAQLGQSRPSTVHYVAPSFWAWKGGERKLKNLAKIVDHMLCILPFEEAVCRSNGLDATFVGHPVLEDAHSVAANGELHNDKNWHIKGNGTYFRQLHGIHPEATVISVLPGSRLQEVHRMLPIFERTLNLLTESVPQLTVVVPTVQNQSLVQIMETALDKWKVPVVILQGASETEKYNAFAASNLGLCTSGTAVMQLLMARVPCVVGYRANLLTEWIIHARTKVRFISLPNILLDTAVIPEALFAACTPSELLTHLRLLLEDKSSQEKQVSRAGTVLSMLAPPVGTNTQSHLRCAEWHVSRQHILTPSAAAASVILRLLEKQAGP